MGWLLEHLTRNWQTFKNAPIVFVLVLVAGIPGGVLISWWKYDAMIQAQEDRYEGIIQAQNEKYEGLLKIKDEHILMKDHQILEYRQRLHLVPPTNTSYSLLSNEELRKKALSVASEIRDFAKECDEFSDTISAKWFAAKSTEDKLKILKLSHDKKAEYEERFKAGSIGLRDELLSRLPKDARDDKVYSMLYEYPTNPIGMNMVAYDLERRAKSLP